MKDNTAQVVAQVPVDVATFLLNEKRTDVLSIETRFKVNVLLVPESPPRDAELQRRAPAPRRPEPGRAAAGVVRHGRSSRRRPISRRQMKEEATRAAPGSRGQGHHAVAAGAAARQPEPAPMAAQPSVPARTVPVAAVREGSWLSKMLGWFRTPARRAHRRQAARREQAGMRAASVRLRASATATAGIVAKAAATAATASAVATSAAMAARAAATSAAAIRAAAPPRPRARRRPASAAARPPRRRAFGLARAASRRASQARRGPRAATRGIARAARAERTARAPRSAGRPRAARGPSRRRHARAGHAASSAAAQAAARAA